MFWVHAENRQRDYADPDSLPARSGQGDRHRRHHRPRRWLSFPRLGTHDVAEWLAARGIAAFVLKYRTAQIEGENEAQLNQSGGARFGAQIRNHALIAEDGKYGIADGIQAIKVVREHAAEWGVSPDRIVFMGFSAGGIDHGVYVRAAGRERAAELRCSNLRRAISSCLRYQKGCRPSSWRWRRTTISPAPKLSLFYDALKAAGYKPEFHIYEHGGHGWSMRKQGTTSDHWIDEFYWWLEAHGLTKPSN